MIAVSKSGRVGIASNSEHTKKMMSAAVGRDMWARAVVYSPVDA